MRMSIPPRKAILNLSQCSIRSRQRPRLGYVLLCALDASRNQIVYRVSKKRLMQIAVLVYLPEHGFLRSSDLVYILQEP